MTSSLKISSSKGVLAFGRIFSTTHFATRHFLQKIMNNSRLRPSARIPWNFDDLSIHLVYEMYKGDFDLSKYDAQDPSNKMPISEIELDEVHAKLSD